MDKAPKSKPRLSGSFPQTVDDRSRLAVPAKLVPVIRALEEVGEEDPVDVVITITKQERLGVYPRSVFWRMIEELEARPAEDVEAEDLRRAYLNYSEEMQLDKQNRFRIPAAHAEVFDLRGEVMVMGSDDYLEVVAKDVWKDQLRASMGLMREKDAKVRGAVRRNGSSE